MRFGQDCLQGSVPVGLLATPDGTHDKGECPKSQSSPCVSQPGFHKDLGGELNSRADLAWLALAILRKYSKVLPVIKHWREESQEKSNFNFLNLHLQKHTSSLKLRRLENLALSKIPLVGIAGLNADFCCGQNLTIISRQWALCSGHGGTLRTKWPQANSQFSPVSLPDWPKERIFSYRLVMCLMKPRGNYSSYHFHKE